MVVPQYAVWNNTMTNGTVAVGLVNVGSFGNVDTSFDDFNVSFTTEAVGNTNQIGVHCTTSDTWVTLFDQD